MALPTNVKKYLIKERKKLEDAKNLKAPIPFDSFGVHMRGYVGGENRISGNEADKNVMRILSDW